MDPGAREKKQLLLKVMDRKERPFSIVGDIKKAHRRFKHLAKEQGFQTPEMAQWAS